MDGTKIRVCKAMFMATLGAKSDSFITEFVKAKRANPEDAILPTRDRRGNKKKSPNTLHDDIVLHINSFNPSVSHYRREYAPNRRYLEAHLSIKGTHIIKNRSIGFKLEPPIFGGSGFLENIQL